MAHPRTLKAIPVEKINTINTMKTMKRFSHFPNHGDEEGKGCNTIVYDFGGDDEIITGATDKTKDAVASCKQLNQVLKIRSANKKELCKEAQRLMVRLLPGKEYGENEDAEAFYEIFNELKNL